MIKAVVFDVDGTIIDSMSLHLASWAEMFERSGYPISVQKLRCQFGRRADFFVRHFIPEASEETIGRIVDGKRRLYRERIDEITLLPGAREFLVGIRAHGAKIGLATSASRLELEYYMERFDLRQIADAALSGDDISRSKPDPEILEKAFERLEVEPGEAVYVGDSPHDMAAAKAAGSLGIGVLTGGYSRESLEQAGAVAVFNSLADVPVEFPLTLGER